LRSLHLFIRCLVTVLSSQSISAPARQSKPDAASVRDQLIGAWRLVSIETAGPNGEIVYLFYGKHPEGLIVYDRSGWMSVQVTSDPPPTVPFGSSREEFIAAATAEKVAAVDGYYAYGGTWTLDTSNSTVTTTSSSRSTLQSEARTGCVTTILKLTALPWWPRLMRWAKTTRASSFGSAFRGTSPSDADNLAIGSSLASHSSRFLP
jgi:hypothetical protein